jgi:hypothetical protein
MLQLCFIVILLLWIEPTPTYNSWSRRNATKGYTWPNKCVNSFGFGRNERVEDIVETTCFRFRSYLY